MSKLPALGRSELFSKMAMKHRQIEIARDLNELSMSAGRYVGEYLAGLAERKKRIAVALSGGTTPKGLYQVLSENFADSIPWPQIHFFWGDERCVAPESPESNYRLAYQALLSRVPVPAENVHRMPGEKPAPQAAEEYELALRRYFGRMESGWPVFDLVILGVGQDGHTASLFPDSPALKEDQRWVIAVYVDKLKAFRLTLTLPVFNQAERLVFLAAGPEKAPVLRHAVAEGNRQICYPYQMVRLVRGPIVFFLDRDAAGLTA